MQHRAVAEIIAASTDRKNRIDEARPQTRARFLA
jgi:hypothetical protein